MISAASEFEVYIHQAYRAHTLLVRHVSIVLCRRGQYPIHYCTLRDNDGVWKEEQAICNIEPALAFQLEFNRLSNYCAKMGSLYEIVEKYLGGIKGHEADTVAYLLSRYASTEQLFGGSIEARVLAS